MTVNTAGLAGVVAGDTAISTVGQNLGLNYRGYAIADLSQHALFEEVAYLLHYGKLPTENELQTYQKRLIELRTIPSDLKTVLKMIPKNTHPMDMLRTATSFLGTLEPENGVDHPEIIADRLLAIMPGILCYWYNYHHKGIEISEQTSAKTLGAHFLTLLHRQEPSILHADFMNLTLILYAEHDFNASTFAARVTTSTLSDFYSAITSAIGTLRGPLHGGANEAAMELIQQFKTPEEAEIELLQMLLRKEKIMGFGHRVYTTSDPRSDIIKPWALKMSQGHKDQHFYGISECIEKVMWREKKLFPNLDFYSAGAYHFANIPTMLFTPIFVLSRLTGWSAHIIEQRENNRLIRPTSNYIGPKPQAYIPLQQR